MRATKQRMIFLADCRSLYASAEKAVRVFCFSVIRCIKNVCSVYNKNECSCLRGCSHE